MHHNHIGVIYPLRELLARGPEELLELGLESVQLQCWERELMTRENATQAKKLLGNKIRVSSFWAGWSGPQVWDIVDGPHTLGLVPPAYRHGRMRELMDAADFGHWLGVEDMATHVGFIPEHPSFPEYRGVVQAVLHVASYCKKQGLYFNLETGQETPVTLMRLIGDVGADNLGINLDPANLILYGRGNPVDALDLFRGHIRGVHIKDGDYPTDYNNLGQERVVGEGSVNFPIFLSKLLQQGYKGDLYIEREIEGDRQRKDIKKAKALIEQLLKA